MQVVRLKNKWVPGFAAQGVSMQSPLVELEHFRELLKCSEDMVCLKSHLGSRYPCKFKLSGAIFGLPSASFLFKTSPFFSSSCHGDSMPPSLARARYSSRSETSHGIESAAPLNPFISAENRIIWLMCLPPSSA